MMTDLEQRAMTLTADLWNTLCEIVGDGDTSDADLAELAAHIHTIQHAVMAQDAARSYPTHFRLLGGTFIP